MRKEVKVLPKLAGGMVTWSPGNGHQCRLFYFSLTTAFLFYYKEENSFLVNSEIPVYHPSNIVDISFCRLNFISKVDRTCSVSEDNVSMFRSNRYLVWMYEVSKSYSCVYE